MCAGLSLILLPPVHRGIWTNPTHSHRCSRPVLHTLLTNFAWSCAHILGSPTCWWPILLINPTHTCIHSWPGHFPPAATLDQSHSFLHSLDQLHPLFPVPLTPVDTVKPHSLMHMVLTNSAWPCTQSVAIIFVHVCLRYSLSKLPKIEKSFKLP